MIPGFTAPSESGSRSDADAAFMRRALELARGGWGTAAPNPMVGAVVVRGGVIVAEGFHSAFGQPHAEVEALSLAGELARGATLYVTLEPCAHVGKTPPCTAAIIAAGITRVVIATRDPNPEAGGGASILEGKGLEVSIGIEEEEAKDLNAPFFHRFASDRPWVTLKLAVTLEGAVADSERASKWITGPEAREEVQRMRAAADAIAVGERTLIADDPSLTIRSLAAGQPPRKRVLFARTRKVPSESRVVATARDTPTFVISPEVDLQSEARLVALGVEVINAPDALSGLRSLKERGVASLLVEGGATVAARLLDAGLVDRLVIFQGPLLLGAGSLNAFGELPARGIGSPLRFRVISRRAFGPDLMTEYAPLER